MAMIDCPLCGRRSKPSIIAGQCLLCWRKAEWKALPPTERERRTVAVVHERYKAAELSHLPKTLAAQLMGAHPTDSIFLWGNEGRGKTYAAAALAREWLAQGYYVERETWDRLCLRLRDTMNPKATQTEWAVIEPLLAADKLILEDIGTTVSVGKIESDFSLRTLLVILDSRSEDCLQTLLTSNKPVEEIAKSFDPRIASRIHQGTIIHKTGDDRRRKKEQSSEA